MRFLSKKKILNFYNLVDGEVIPIEKVPDEMFSEKMMGDGIAVIPSSNTIVAPCDAEITMIFPTKHAMGIRLENGCEALLHFGIDTVLLKGAGFEVYTEVGSHVRKGEPLLEVDRDYIAKNAKSNMVVIVFTKNPKNFELVKKYGQHKQGELILEVRE